MSGFSTQLARAISGNQLKGKEFTDETDTVLNACKLNELICKNGRKKLLAISDLRQGAIDLSQKVTKRVPTDKTSNAQGRFPTTVTLKFVSTESTRIEIVKDLMTAYEAK